MFEKRTLTVSLHLKIETQMLQNRQPKAVDFAPYVYYNVFQTKYCVLRSVEIDENTSVIQSAQTGACSNYHWFKTGDIMA